MVDPNNSLHEIPVAVPEEPRRMLNEKMVLEIVPVGHRMPVETGEPVALPGHFFAQTTGASDTRHSPRPLLRRARALYFFGAELISNLGQMLLREY
jgi:hypothetical protein